jgi:hypothetical protein
MRKIVEVHLIVFLFLALAIMFMGANLAHSQRQPDSNQQESLRSFLQTFLREHSGREESTTRYSSAMVDLRDDGTKEAIVYITGRTSCGSGGCRMLVLLPSGTSYQVVGETTVTRPPIRVLATKSNGWHDISVWVQGGGIQPGHDAVLSFDGKAYPRNPSLTPARPLDDKAIGTIAIPPKAAGEPLYQRR